MRGMMMTTSPLLYDRTKQYIATKYNWHSSDPDFEDRYHDTWVQFLTHWNGEGNPLGAFSLMFSQWYSKRQERKRQALWVSVYDQRGMSRSQQEGADAFDPWEAYEDYCMTYSVQKFSLIQAVRKATLSTAQQDLLVLTLIGYSAEEIGDMFGVSRQSIESRYNKVIRKIHTVIN
jgi:DNA-directed RNA polymerase specialized sigma24 family protein